MLKRYGIVLPMFPIAQLICSPTFGKFVEMTLMISIRIYTDPTCTEFQNLESIKASFRMDNDEENSPFTTIT